MDNVSAIYQLWVRFFFGNEENYINWLQKINERINQYHFPSWIMDIINAFPYIFTILSFIFVIYLFYLIILLFKSLINAINPEETISDNQSNFSDCRKEDKVKTYYYFSKKPGRKKRRY